MNKIEATSEISGSTTSGLGSGLASGSSSGAVSVADANSWYEALARAWGGALDQQAGKIANMSEQITEMGQDQPSQMTVLTAESMKMQFMASNASTSMNSIGQALESLSRKQ